jgi:predicted phosphodiesterase
MCAAGEDAAFAITHGPCLQAPGATEVTVSWHTNRVGISQVLYRAGDGPEQSAVTSEAGLIPNDSTCHAVRVTGLKPGTAYQYKVVTREFVKYKTPYKVEFGATVESEPLTFTTLSPEKTAFSFLMWNDVHDNSKRLQAMFNDVSWSGVDFVVLNGDILNDFVTQEQPFRGFYDAIVNRFAKTTPMVFVRGNHETRGPVARRMADFFPGQGGRYYWSFDQGPAHFVVLDSGEDKPDANVEYAGLVDFARYREEQTEWLRADLASEAARNAKFRVVLSHQPSAFGNLDHFGVQEIRRLWDPIINAANVQLWLSGHLHNFVERAPHEGGDNVYRAIMNPQDGTTRVDVTADELKVTVIEKGGKVLSTASIR